MYRKGLLFTSILLLSHATACIAGEPSYSAHVWEDIDGDGNQ